MVKHKAHVQDKSYFPYKVLECLFFSCKGMCIQVRGNSGRKILQKIFIVNVDFTYTLNIQNQTYCITVIIIS